jgi:quercetin dioxygenase-like cupin family protein
MTAAGFILAEQDRAPAYGVLGEEIQVLASGDETGGYELFVQKGGPGLGPPPHAHEWDESFYILNGKVEVGIEGETRLCGPGALAHVPAGTTHWYRFVTEGEILSVTSRLGASSFFAEVDRKDAETTIAATAGHGVTCYL